MNIGTLEYFKKHRLTLAVFWTVAVIIASLIPNDGSLRSSFLDIPGLDKVVHFVFYAVMTFLWAFFLKKNYSKGRSSILSSFICVSIGCLVEFGQITVTYGRSFDPWDILANVIGVIFGVTIFLLMGKFLAIFVK